MSTALSCVGLSKSFGGVAALSNLDFDLKQGEVRALLGKNGAGKSTLVNLLSGSLQPDAGALKVGSQDVRWGGPKDAQKGGIAVVHQEFSLVPGLSVSENISLGRWPKRFAMIDRAAERKLARKALDRLGVQIPVGALVATLSLAEQQIVEIAKSLVEQPHVLILDEPTSALNSSEVEYLIRLIRRLADSGMSIIYVSHRMKEIPLVADSLTILRDGKEIITDLVKNLSPEQVAEHISGEQPTERTRRAQQATDSPVVLEVKDLSVGERVKEVSFQLREGEVLGIAGLLGSGRTEILQSIFGLRRDSTGTVLIKNREQRARSPRRMLRQGVAYISEDRKGSGIVPRLSVGENILLTARGRVLPGLWINELRESEVVQRAFNWLSIRASTAAQEIGTLSGGNQQKAVIARALSADMKVLLLDEPTRGVDLQAKGQMYRLVRELGEQGVACIFVSSELEEIAEVADRVLVLRDGRLGEEVTGSDITLERVLALAMKREEQDD